MTRANPLDITLSSSNDDTNGCPSDWTRCRDGTLKLSDFGIAFAVNFVAGKSFDARTLFGIASNTKALTSAAR